MANKDEKTVSIPYIEGLSEAIRRVLAPLGIRTAMRSAKIKWSIMHEVKDKLQSREIPGVVYAVGCKECAKWFMLAKPRERPANV